VLQPSLSLAKTRQDTPGQQLAIRPLSILGARPEDPVEATPAVTISRRKPPDARADPGRRIRKVSTRLKGKSQKKGGPDQLVGAGKEGIAC